MAEVLEHANMLIDNPQLQASCVAVDCSDCVTVGFRFRGMFTIVSKLRWDWIKRLKGVLETPTVHFLVPTHGVHGQVRQFQEICGSFSFMNVVVHHKPREFHASISDAGLDYSALVQVAASHRSGE